MALPTFKDAGFSCLNVMIFRSKKEKFCMPKNRILYRPERCVVRHIVFMLAKRVLSILIAQNPVQLTGTAVFPFHSRQNRTRNRAVATSQTKL